LRRGKEGASCGKGQKGKSKELGFLYFIVGNERVRNENLRERGFDLCTDFNMTEQTQDESKLMSQKKTKLLS
jgi:hypothetical protein